MTLALLEPTSEALTKRADNLPSTDTIARREKIFALQDALMAEPGAMPGVTHVFAPDAMSRTMVIPKGVVIVGKIHKHAHLNIISYGHVMVYTEQDGLLELRGPIEFTSKPGTKRAVLALEETRWTTVHVTTETDLDKVEDYVIAKSYEEYEQFRLEATQPQKVLT